MKIAIECTVVSQSALKSTVTCTADAIEFTFLPGENGKLAAIRLTLQVPDPSRFYSEITPGSPPFKVNIEAKADLELLARLQQEFQTLESLMGFEYSVEKIGWEHAHYQLIAETLEENERLNLLTSIDVTKHRVYAAPELTPSGLQYLVTYRRRYATLIPALAFYREAVNDQASERFINAFVNFYYVVEGLYGRGKTKNYQVVHEFKRSPVLVEAARQTVQLMQSDFPEQHAQLLQDLTARGKTTSPDDLLHFVVDLRGDLHHFTGTASKRHGVPFYHAAYEGAALLAHGLATHGLLQLVVKINRAAQQLPAE
jgi:hypothetical protein